MNAKYHNIPIKPQKSFNFRHEMNSDFGDLFHFHPELELRHIVKGKGVQLIGDDVSVFSEGSMFLLGENLPHAWRFEKKYRQEDPCLNVESHVIEFSTQFSSQFSNLPEAVAVKTLYEKAKQGMIITGETKTRLADLLQKLEPTDSLKNIVLLLDIVRVLSETNEYTTISPGFVTSTLNYVPEHDRLEKVFLFIRNHYSDEIKLDEVAALANFSASAFCRYFKSVTNQTFTEYVNQIRISRACRKMIEKNGSIESISYECGFNTISNFNRQFRRITGMTPFNYKKAHMYFPKGNRTIDY
ncbi:AraC family transcriptional regulator [Algoriphagus aquimarinus]|uniref:AraC family transcriptional regulator n=1 Tax=Algoriphagus aquimarinus TaxID=237018 RepID=A0A5C7B6B3_9BACT|nr:AraC family transcriptional regulator [Algoriphagus aquimarinus]TXE13412.1 AraC family transcriptional regulator [Algoriphagus aquimarinus]